MNIKTIVATAAGLLLTTHFAMAQQPVLYTSNPVHAVEAVNAEAQKKMGAALSVVTGGSGVLMRRLEAEKSAPQGDLFWSASPGTLGAYKDLFQSYDSPELATIPERFRYPDNLFQPANVHVVTLMVNTDLLDGAEAPKSWADLADPKWNGKIISVNPNNSSMGFTVSWGLSKILDQENYKAVVSNLVMTEASSSVPKGVAMGEYPIGINVEYMTYQYIAGGQKEIEMVYPSEGTFLTVDYVGLVKNAPAGKKAEEAVDVLLSKETQTELLKVSFRRPSRSDIKVSDYVNLPELDTIKIFPIDEIAASEVRETFLQEWDALPKAGESK